MMRREFDLVVVGAGPAGLAAADEAARLGVSTALVDEQADIGGQIYRAISASPLGDRRLLGADYWHGAQLAERFRASGAAHIPNATVWNISSSLELDVSIERRGASVGAREIILATGAMERPFPFLGWTRPGVMTVGAAQTLLKSTGAHLPGKVVLAGTGPLLWLLAAQYLRTGVGIEAILDTTPRGNLRPALRHAAGFLLSPYFRKGWSLLAEVLRWVPVISNVTRLEACGNGAIEEVAYTTGAGRSGRIGTQWLLIHQGVMPNVNAAMAIGCRHHWDDVQACFHPALGSWFESSVAGISIAGDGAGIGGARVAEASGRLAALAAAARLGAIDPRQRDRQAKPHRRALRHWRAGRRFLDLLHRPQRAHRIPGDDIIVCRCEEVTAGDLRAAVELGCPGPNQAKAFLRCGMGPCQGRLCGLSVTEVMADAHGVAPGEIGHYRPRPPFKPVTLGEIAGFPTNDAAVRAVVRDLPPGLSGAELLGPLAPR
ncbi:MAG TPA: (2Fe-2S)-binding protein [Rhizomicrobium sp.]|nr:(2Fe-2S)-binding protein [Rhizomicrobium sp.]